MKEQLMQLIKSHNAVVEILSKCDIPVPEGKLFRGMEVWHKIACEGAEIAHAARSIGIDAVADMQSGVIYSKGEQTAMFGCKMDTLWERDNVLKKLWAQFGNVPMDPQTECIEEQFMLWGPGTHREEIWHWFDERYSTGGYCLLYGDSAGDTTKSYPELAMYDEDHRLDLCRDDPELDAKTYEIIFKVEYNHYYCYIDGCDSLLEALGFFFKDNPHITYDMIVEHIEA